MEIIPHFVCLQSTFCVFTVQLFVCLQSTLYLCFQSPLRIGHVIMAPALLSPLRRGHCEIGHNPVVTIITVTNPVVTIFTMTPS